MRIPAILDEDPHVPDSEVYVACISRAQILFPCCRESSRVKQESLLFFTEQEKDMKRASREAGAVLRQIDAEARERAGESLAPNLKKPGLVKLQAWGSFRDAMHMYAQLLSSPRQAHPAVAKEMELLSQVWIYSLRLVTRI